MQHLRNNWEDLCENQYGHYVIGDCSILFTINFVHLAVPLSWMLKFISCYSDDASSYDHVHIHGCHIVMIVTMDTIVAFVTMTLGTVVTTVALLLLRLS
jgi:hypothetical protein